jgi:plasmid stabilization system protein ParE
MTLAVVFRPEASVDLDSARRWYENQQPGLGSEFARSVADTITRVQGMPRMYVRVLEDVRRAKLRRFPYLIYYRLLADRVEVLAVLHGSRHQDVWQERVR